MKNSKQKQAAYDFLETPAGLFTSGGFWFRINIKSFKNYTRGLLDIIPLKTLLFQAEQWIRATDGFGILFSMIFLFFLDWIPAVGLSLFTGILFHLYKPLITGSGLQKVASLFDKDWFMMLIPLAPLSYFGMEGMFAHLGIGFLLFMIFKFGWMRKVAGYVYAKLNSSIPYNDRILFRLTTSYAIANDISLSNFEVMQKDIAKAIDMTINKKYKK